MATDLMYKAHCPKCETTIRMDKKPELESLISCPECDETLEVASTNPVRLIWAYDDRDEDDDDYEDYDDEPLEFPD